jgi:hypothetical protein
MEALQAKCADRDVAFLYVYTREPHPNQRMRGFDFGEEPQTRSIEERRRNAKRCVERHALTIPWIVDEMDGRIQRAYGGLPNSAFLVRSDGVVAYKEAWADAGRLEAEISKLQPPAFYLASPEARKALLRVYEDALRLQRAKTPEARTAAAEALAAARVPAALPRLGRGLLDPDAGVRCRSWELLKGLLELAVPFDPAAADEPRAEAAGRVLAALRAAEKTHRWDEKTLRFLPCRAPGPGKEKERGAKGD